MKMSGVMNDLRLLLQVDSEKRVMRFQFKQITSLDGMMPLLVKFENLESLSLHGNRLKSLPADMSKLQSLIELDISNNLFSDIHAVISSLKTIPHLAHLLYSFKNEGQEDLLRKQLPSLERINKQPIAKNSQHSLNSQKNTKDTLKLSESDLENVGVIYDQIRQIYRDHKYLMDKQLADDFDYNVQNIMADMTQKLKVQDSKAEKNCTIMCGKYALIDLCFVKLITFFYHFDKKIGSVLEKIHDQQASMFKTMTEMLIEEVNREKIQFANVKLQKEELYKKELKRVKSYQLELNQYVETLETENRELLDRVVKLTKTNSALESTLNKNKKIKTSRSPSKSHSCRTPTKQNGKNNPKSSKRLTISPKD